MYLRELVADYIMIGMAFDDLKRPGETVEALAKAISFRKLLGSPLVVLSSQPMASTRLAILSGPFVRSITEGRKSILASSVERFASTERQLKLAELNYRLRTPDGCRLAVKTASAKAVGLIIELTWPNMESWQVLPRGRQPLEHCLSLLRKLQGDGKLNQDQVRMISLLQQLLSIIQGSTS